MIKRKSRRVVVVNGREEFVFGEHVFDSSALYPEAVLRPLGGIAAPYLAN